MSLERIEEDLRRGFLDRHLVVRSYSAHPERVIYTICKLGVENNNRWISRDEIQARLIEDLRENLNPAKKWNPVDWFSSNYTRFEKDLPLAAKEIISRWYHVLDRRKAWRKERVYHYRIRDEYYDEIKKIIERMDSNV